MKAEDRIALGALFRAAREDKGLLPSEVALLICEKFPNRRHLIDVREAWIEEVERGGRVHNETLLELAEEIEAALECGPDVSDAWYQQVNMVPPSMVKAILEHPERWNAVRAALEGGERKSRG